MGTDHAGDDWPSEGAETGDGAVIGSVPAREREPTVRPTTVSSVVDELTRRWTTLLRLLVPAVLLAILVYQAVVRFPAEGNDSGAPPPSSDAVAP